MSEEWETNAERERQAKARLSDDLSSLIGAMDDFLSGEVRDGLITSFKLTLIVQAKTMQALAERCLRDVPEVQVR